MRKLYSQSAITVTAGAMLLGMATGASALEIKSGNDKVQVKLYGHLARAVMFADDGRESKAFHVDNTNSESRIGLDGKLEVSETLTLGSNFELQWQSNPSDKVSLEEESISGKFEERLLDIYADSKPFGKFLVGPGQNVLG